MPGERVVKKKKQEDAAPTNTSREMNPIVNPLTPDLDDVLREWSSVACRTALDVP